MPQLPRIVWLVLLAMTMFAAGVIVWVRANDTDEHILAGVAILGAIAVVLANVNGTHHND